MVPARTLTISTRTDSVPKSNPMEKRSAMRIFFLAKRPLGNIVAAEIEQAMPPGTNVCRNYPNGFYQERNEVAEASERGADLSLIFAHPRTDFLLAVACVDGGCRMAVLQADHLHAHDSPPRAHRRRDQAADRDLPFRRHDSAHADRGAVRKRRRGSCGHQVQPHRS